jgi:hypothetical protein
LNRSTVRLAAAWIVLAAPIDLPPASDGVVFVDEKTISAAGIGGLVFALVELVKETENWDWMDRVVFLRR